jgi:excisionase family DNA binding protein
VADDFYSFDEALDELKLKEEELKRLVSEGELRAFRKGDTMKIRRADVELLRAELDADVADLDDTVDELVFEDDSDLDADAGMATQELDVETLVDEEEPVAAEPARASRSSASARPAKRSAVAAAAAEEEEEPAWVKGLLMVSALLLMLAMPIMLSLGTGNAGGLAKGVAGLFGAEFDQAAASQPAASQPAEAPADE